MTTPAHRRHDISDEVWKKLSPHLPGREGSWGGVAYGNRTFINAVFWIMRTGVPWRDLPPDFGGWSNTHLGVNIVTTDSRGRRTIRRS